MRYGKLLMLVACGLAAWTAASPPLAQNPEKMIEAKLGERVRVGESLEVTPSIGSRKSIELLGAVAGSGMLVVDLLFEGRVTDHPEMPVLAELRWSNEPTKSGTLLLAGKESIAPDTLAIYSPEQTSPRPQIFSASDPHPLPRTDADHFGWILSGKGVLAIKFKLTPEQSSATKILLVAVYDKLIRIPVEK